MALTKRNNNAALMAQAARIAMPIIKQALVSPTTMDLAAYGFNTVKDAVSARRQRKKKKGNGAVAVVGPKGGGIAAPVAVSRIMYTKQPQFQKGVGSVTITHRELVGEFKNSPGLVVNQGVTGNLYRLNPSNSSLFPWLQTLASNFDEYCFRSVVLRYVPSCTTQETGRLAMYFDKDSQDLEPADRIELSSIGHQTSTSAWAEATLRVPVDQKRRFTDDSNTADPKLLDLGQVGIATYGGGGTNVLGDVFIEYSITFNEPQPSSGVVQTIVTGAGTDNTVGPKFVTIVSDSTSATMTVRAPGTYLITQFQRATTVSGVTASVGATITSVTNLLAPPCYATMATVIVDRPGATITWAGTGFTFRTTQVVRAKRGNVSVVL